jgi:hypothetical protein
MAEGEIMNVIRCERALFSAIRFYEQ